MLNSACNDFGVLNLPNDGRLTARPHSPSNAGGPGRIMLGLDRDRDAILQLPKAAAKGPVPLFVMLHGATQSADDMFEYLGSSAEDAGVAIMAPNSRDRTWDAINGYFGRDVGFINHALEQTFAKAAIDPARLGIGGFSDGASYGLSLGLINGDLFNRIVAFSPGFVMDGTTHGTPRIFVSHGKSDPILPIDRCSRRIVADLKGKGYDVTLREFEGVHEIPEQVMKEGLTTIGAS
jgi:predicted esterase